MRDPRDLDPEFPGSETRGAARGAASQTFELSWRVAMTSGDLSLTARMVGMVLAMECECHGTLTLSIAADHIAKKAGISLRSVPTALRTLEDAGWVQVDRTIGGRGKTNTYTLCFAARPSGRPDPVPDPKVPVSPAVEAAATAQVPFYAFN